MFLFIYKEILENILGKESRGKESRGKEMEMSFNDELSEDSEEEVEDEDVQEQIAEVEESPEEINDEAEEELTTDSILELSRVLKPIIASVPDVRKRKQMSDSLATVLRKHAKKAQDSKKNTNYSKMLNRTTDSAVNSNVDFGMMIAQKYNPHYKEEK